MIMIAPAQRNHVYAEQARWLARVIAVTLVVLWAAYVVAEIFRDQSLSLPPALCVQGAILAVIFAGYAIGWRKELIGGWLAIIGSATLFALAVVTQNLPVSSIEMAWFAVPGVLYLLARHYDRRPAKVFAD